MHRLPVFAVLFIFVVLLPDIYITRTFLSGSSFIIKLLQWAPTLFLLLAFAGASTGLGPRMPMFSVFFILVLCFILPKFLFMLLSGAGHIMSFPKAGDAAGLVLAVLFCIAAGYGLGIGWKKVNIREVELSFENLPESFDGYRIAQFSDWHLGTYTGSIETIEKEIDKTLEARPDLVVFTGDIVNGDAFEMKPFMGILSKLEAKDGVFSVMGNHDYCMYSSVGQSAESTAKNIAELQQNEISLGWNLLLNDNRIISNGRDSIAVIGVENDGTPPFPERGDLVKAQQNLPDGIFKVLLSHDPTHWRRKVLPDTDIDLTLSGHTHAAQFRIGRFSPSRWFYKDWGGLYQEGDRKLYISTGSGGNIPFRFGAWPEVVIITLRKK